MFNSTEPPAPMRVVDAATNTEVQQDLADEVIKLKKLDYIPVYPIVSIGLAYRF
jgi:hypothetical protein